MIPSNEGKNVVKLGLTSTSATASSALSFDTSGQDQANVYVGVGSHTTTTAAITAITVAESDTATAPSSMTAIAALSSGTATSATVSNVLPIGAVQGLGGIVNELQIDLRKRKKYVGVTVVSAVVAVSPITTQARLTRSEQSADTAAQKAGIDLTATSVSGCMAVIAD